MRIKLDWLDKPFSLPDSFRVVNKSPGDPPGSIPLMSSSEGTTALVLVYPKQRESAMPFSSPEVVINGIHASLGDDQGLIAVNTGLFSSGMLYIFSIVKTKQEPSGMQYYVCMDVDIASSNLSVFHIDGFFTETGMTGVRDAICYERAVRQGIVQAGSKEKWFEDPYDSNYKKGIRMNLSEREDFDESFPLHPLSEARSFIGFISTNN